MKAGGILLALAGVWVLTQVLGGDALKRLGVTGKASADEGGALGGITVPSTPGPHDALGRPL
jgi:hypothetical protein